MAMFGIALLAQPISSSMANFFKSNSIIVKYLRSSFAVSIAASIGTIPLVAYYFDIFVFLSPIINLFVIPLMSLSMGFSLISIIISYFYIPLAQIYSYASQFCIELSILINKFFIKLPYTYIQSSELLIPSLLFVILVTYIIFSNNLKQIIFRLVLSVLIFISIINLNLKSPNQSQIIYPSEQFVSIELPYTKSILIFDRMPAQNPQMDFSFFNYLRKQIQKNKINKLLYSGNAGLYYIDKLKYQYKINSYEMDLDFQKKILNQLNLFSILQKVDYE